MIWKICRFVSTMSGFVVPLAGLELNVAVSPLVVALLAGLLPGTALPPQFVLVVQLASVAPVHVSLAAREEPPQKATAESAATEIAAARRFEVTPRAAALRLNPDRRAHVLLLFLICISSSGE
jgi:hypothetical protein